MSNIYRQLLFITFIGCLLLNACHAEERVFPEIEREHFTLRYHDEIPVATFRGTPEKIGKQHAMLLAEGWEPLRKYAFDFLGFDTENFRWKMLLAASNGLIANAPETHRRELDSLTEHAGDNGQVVRVVNTLPELRRFGCSTLIVQPERSATGGPLFGRNLDFPTLGVLDKYNLVMVFKTEGKRPFVSISLPGVVGVLSGMNDAGLAVATLDSYRAADGSPGFEPSGEPVAFVFRQLLEECETVDEAEKLLKSTTATTWMNLSVCDREGGAVFEITPKQVVRRDAEDAILPCTNHFRTEELVVHTHCRRYDILSQATTDETLDVEDIRQYLHAANQGELTFQTMVFEPRTLVVHLAFGPLPSSGNSLQRMDLKPLLTDE